MEEDIEIPNDCIVYDSAILSEQLKDCKFENETLKNKFDSCRAKFKEVYVAKDNELRDEKSRRERLEFKVRELETVLENTFAELNDSKTAAALNFSQREEEFDRIEENLKEEIVSLNSILRETIEQTKQMPDPTTDIDVNKRSNHILEDDTKDVRSNSKLSNKKSSNVIISAIDRVVGKKLITTPPIEKSKSSHRLSEEEKELEDSMNEAKANTNLLKSIIVPMETEIAELKSQLQSRDQTIRSFTSASLKPISGEDAETQPPLDYIMMYENRTHSLQSELVRVRDELVSTKRALESEKSFNSISSPDVDRYYSRPRSHAVSKFVDATQRLSVSASDLTNRTYDKEAGDEAPAADSAGYKRKVKEDDSVTEREHQSVKELEAKTLTFAIQQDYMDSFAETLKESVQSIEANMTEQLKLLMEDSELVQKEISEFKSKQRDIAEMNLRVVQESGDLSPEQLVEKYRDLLAEYAVSDEGRRSDLQQANRKIEVLTAQLEKATKDADDNVVVTNHSNKEDSDHALEDYKRRNINLKQELNNSEQVQHDFVKLSQSLQMELEALREDHSPEVRWQFEGDIDDCQRCRELFTEMRKKHRCKHCCKIYCKDCLPHTMFSGTHATPTQVCSVCYTLLNKNAVPYFGSTVPNT